MIQLWRGLFPSWKFFDQVGDRPQAYVRSAPSTIELESASWRPLLAGRKRGGWELFLNPQTNFLLFQDTLLRQLVQESQTDFDLEASASFQSLFRAAQLASPGACFQFKVFVVSTQEDLLVSAAYEGGA